MSRLQIRFGSYIPFGFGGMALPGHIYLSASIDDYKLSPDQFWTIVAHERIHHRQQRGWFYFPIFLLRYFLSTPFRIRAEAEAYGRANLVGQKHGDVIPAMAEGLASMIYDRYGKRFLSFGSVPTIACIKEMLLEHYTDEVAKRSN